MLDEVGGMTRNGDNVLKQVIWWDRVFVGILIGVVLGTFEKAANIFQVFFAQISLSNIVRNGRMSHIELISLL